MELSEIKQQLSILEVLRQYGLSPDRNNRLKCPFHTKLKIYQAEDYIQSLSEEQINSFLYFKKVKVISN